ncbi:MAG: hypothetical protein L0287_19125, partial [Anaerolineae bacterium]|nr:hypothetical protein [Anaerolineae bacterium]
MRNELPFHQSARPDGDMAERQLKSASDKIKNHRLTCGPIFTRLIYENWPLPLSHAASPQLVMAPAGLPVGEREKAGAFVQSLKITSACGREWRRDFGT